MSAHLPRWAWVGLLSSMLFAIGGIVAFTQTATLTVSASPASFNPSTGQTTTITYKNAVKATAVRIEVKSSSGATVRTVASFNLLGTGTWSRVWDGKNSSGSVVPAGTYTVVFSGKDTSGRTLTPATTNVTVVSTTTPPPSSDPGTLTVSASPASFDPAKGERTTITYKNSVKATSVRIEVKSSSGATVRTVASFNLLGAGTWSRTWDGKNSSGSVVPAGAYTVVFSGKDTNGRTLTPATCSVTVAGSSTPPPTTNYAFKINSITPATIDTTKGQTTTISYAVPTTCDLRVFVKNSAGAEVRTLAQVSGAAAGTRTATWDGKNGSGNAVANGTYTVTVESPNATNITPASGTVTVTSSPVTPPPTDPTDPVDPSDDIEKGQVIVGAGSSNWDWTKRPGYKMGISFKSPKTGTLTQVTMQWKKSTGYGAGNYGRYTFELHTNGAGNFPSGNILAKLTNVNPSTAMDGYIDGALHVPLSAQLTAGQIYHIVIYNTDPNPSANFSSPNGLMTDVKPWDGTGNRTCYYSNGSWKPYGSTNSPWNTAKSNNVNCHYTATMLTWSDGTNTGYPYYSASLSGSARIYGNSRAGQYIVWDKPTTTIRRIGISVRKIGSPGPLIFHLDKVSGGSLATGTVNTSSLNSTYQTWAYATLSSPVTLQQGQAYRLWFESPSSSSSSNSYLSYAIYGEARPAAWSALSWGGTKSYYIYGSNLSSSMPQADLSFSLQ